MVRRLTRERAREHRRAHPVPPQTRHGRYRYALRAFKDADWIAKTEDDGLVWLEPLLRELWPLRADRMVYVGMMQWQGSCSAGEALGPAAPLANSSLGRRDTAATGGASRFAAPWLPSLSQAERLALSRRQVRAQGQLPCAGCWGGWCARTTRPQARAPAPNGDSRRPPGLLHSLAPRRYRQGAPPPHACGSMWRRGWGGSVRLGTPECPLFRLSPFACGPFEARSRPLAEAVGQCEYASRYFDVISRHGNEVRDWCVSADGSQGHVISHCVRALTVADLGIERQRYATVKQMNASNGVYIVHPIKSRGVEHNAARLPQYVSQWKAAWTYLRRAPYRPARGHGIPISRVSFAPNASRPHVERLPLPKPSPPHLHEARARGQRGNLTERRSEARQLVSAGKGAHRF